MTPQEIKDAILAGDRLPSLPPTLRQHIARATDGEAVGERGAGVSELDLRQALRAMFLQFPVRCLSVEREWEGAARRADFARAIAQACKAHSVFESVVAALLTDVGRLALDALLPEGYRYASDSSAVPSTVLESEWRSLGVDHALAGKWLCQRWELPSTLTLAVWLHHQPPSALQETLFPRNLIDIIAVADALCASVSAPLEGGAELDQRCERLGLRREQLDVIRRETGEDLAREALPMPFTLPQDGRVTGFEARIERLQALQRLHVDLTPRVDSVLHEAARLARAHFSFRGGLCFLADRKRGYLRGWIWRLQSAEIQGFRISLENSAAPGDSVSFQPLWEYLRRLSRSNPSMPEETQFFADLLYRRGLIAVPITLRGSAAGQFVVESDNRLAETDLQDLFLLAKSCGAALDRLGRQELLEEQAEALAASLQRSVTCPPVHDRTAQQRVLAQLAAGAAHEINNPLAVISGRAQMLLNRTQDPTTVRSLGAIIDQTRRANKILVALMQFARPPAPKLEPMMVAFVLHQVVVMVRDRLLRKGIEIIEDYDPSAPRAPLDRHQMEEVFLQLLANAENAIDDRGGHITVRLTTTQSRDQVLVDIGDSGAGVSPESIERVFDPFYTTWEAKGGSGLGLSVTRGLVEAHGGSVALRSEVGRGTTVSLRLPAMKKGRADVEAPVSPNNHAGAAVAEAEPPEESFRSLGRKDERRSGARLDLLVLEADETLLEVLCESLRQRGYTCKGASNVIEGKTALMEHRPVLVLMDLDLTGLEESGILTQLSGPPPVTVIGLAGNAFQASRRHAMPSGLCTIIDKPFELQRLMLEIDHAVRARNVA